MASQFFWFVVLFLLHEPGFDADMEWENLTPAVQKWKESDASFGNRLANGRNLAHTEVPLAPPHEQNRTSVGYIALGAANSVREVTRMPPGVSRHGWEIESYRSPFEYNIASHSISGNKVALNQFIAYILLLYRPRTVSFGSMRPVDTCTRPNVVIYETETETEGKVCRVVTPGPNAKERLLLLGPLLVIRNTAVPLRSDDRETLHTFIDKYMGESLRTILQRNVILPEVVYRISIPMADTNWAKYNQVLSVFGFANGADEMLAKGSDGFDKYRYMVDGKTSNEYIEGWKVLASAGARGIGMEMLS
ncbi:carbohydrate-binding module family 35 protein [Stemphylium lycopersici]|uniref:Carbohydrate-binding module family 35 protein n=1 Tax=Stemphylium lycopersici TaxID=183478 RepID=A0A364MSM0_STELY|nr:carbohydrate-binding module family 35 protein [Stemphylium lycopersici]